MKKLSNAILLSLFLFVGLFVLSIPAQVGAILLPILQDSGGGGGGGGGETPYYPPPVETKPMLDFTYSLDDQYNVYTANEGITLTTKLTYNACTNSAKNIVIEGYIEGGEYYKFYDSTVVGGSSTGDAPLTHTYKNIPAGEYNMKVKATAYSPEYYSVEIGSVEIGDDTKISAFTLEELEKEVQYRYKFTYLDDVNPENFDGSESFIDNSTGIKYPITRTPTGTAVIAHLEDDIPFTVIDVKVFVNDKPGDTVTSGGDAYVRWEPKPASIASCKCECTDETGKLINCGSLTTSSCGSGTDRQQPSTPNPIPNVTKKTVFKVTCSKP